VSRGKESQGTSLAEVRNCDFLGFVSTISTNCDTEVHEGDKLHVIIQGKRAVTSATEHLVPVTSDLPVASAADGADLPRLLTFGTLTFHRVISTASVAGHWPAGSTFEQDYVISSSDIKRQIDLVENHHKSLVETRPIMIPHHNFGCETDEGSHFLL
jgi:hypothetical protein